MHGHDQVVRLFRRKLAILLAARTALALGAAWLFVWGTIVLLCRGAAGTPRLPLLWGLAGLLPAAVVAALLAWRRLPSATAVRALIDRQYACGGLLMASEQCPLGDWQRTVPRVGVPDVHWRGRRSWGLFATSSAFVLLCFLVPDRLAKAGADPALEIGAEADKLAKQIDVLKDEAVFEPERADALKEKLERLRNQASGKDPAKTLEALDHLENIADQAAKEAAESSLKKTEQLAKTETLADALREAMPDLDAKTLSEAMKDLAAMAGEAAAENEAVRKELDPETLKAIRENALKPGDLKKLASAAKKGKREIARRLEELQKARMIDRETLKECEKCASGNSNKLASALRKCSGKNKGQGSKGAITRAINQKGGGSGGPDDRYSEGGEGTPLSWGEPSSEEGVKYKEKVLSPAEVQSLKDSQLIGLSQRAPTTEPGAPSRSGALNAATPGGGSAHTQVILPRHRGAVERFFNRPAAVKPGP